MRCAHHADVYLELPRATHARAASLLEHAQERGANAIIGIRYDATEIMQGVTEVLVYGTAVTVRKV